MSTRSKNSSGDQPEQVVERLAPMIAYIEQESDEKVDEIQVRADEEAKIEVQKVVQQQCEQIQAFYTRKHRQLDIQHKVHESNTANQARLECLKERERLMNEVMDETRQDLWKISEDKERYPQILKGLIMQGLLQLLEKEVILRCRKEDQNLIESMLKEINDDQLKIADLSTKVTIDIDKYLSDRCSGGVEIRTMDGKIAVMSTLESRLDLIAGQIVPQIRTALFGMNPNRAFFE